MSIREEKTLLLIVDIKDMMGHKTILKNTQNYDSIQTKREQVYNNLISNSLSLYNKLSNHKINEEIDKRIQLIEQIECNAYNENELVSVRLELKRKTIDDINKYLINQYNDTSLTNIELDRILSDFTRDYFAKQQSTTMFLKYKGKDPNSFVLKRLEKIGRELDQQNGVLIRRSKMEKIINDLFNPDYRTLNNYLQCLTDFGSQNGKPVSETFSEISFNMRGFSNTVAEYIKENAKKYAK